MFDTAMQMESLWGRGAIAFVVAVALAYVAAEVGARLVRLALVAAFGGDKGVDFRSPALRRPVRIARWTIFTVALATLGLPALRLAGLPIYVGVEPERLGRWVFDTGLRIAVIVLGAFILVRVIGVLSARIENAIAHDVGAERSEQLKRARTLSRLMRNAASVAVVTVAGLMILQHLSIDIVPILTGAGILGVAVGFGGQALVKDLISGCFLIIENHIRVGDVVTLNGTSGFVEAVNFRTVILRDLEGVVHIVPNGLITTLSNQTMDYSYYVVDVGVAYAHDTDDVVNVLRVVGTELASDPDFAPSVLEPLEILGVDDFAESHVTIKIRIKTLPLKQWEVGRELRRRIKKAFDANGIEIPVPQLSIAAGRQARPFVHQAVPDAR